jgi:aspartyl-tRNA(Asn)/glutamyl-tRNA(Gln) amidotransferase subunit A
MSESGESWRLGVAGLSDLLARRAVSPVELLELFLARIERINPAINAIVAIDGEARAAAAESERRWAAGEPRSALEGIPLTVKDNIPVRGLPTTWGSRMFRDVVPTRDELPVARLRAAGAVILGKTNCPEFTLEGYTDNPLFGVTRNPWDTELTPGGSSGGAVASVAAGLVPAAIGTDGGGSIRRPASHTGLVGLKPSTGLVARDHGLPQVLLDFEAVGPMARRVTDVRLLLDVMAGPDRRDRKSLCAAPAAPPPDPIRLLYVPTFGGNPLDPEIAESCTAAARAFGELGCAVEEGLLPFDMAPVDEIWPVFAEVAVAFLLDQNPARRDQVAEKFIAMAERGEAIPAHRYLDAIETVDRLRRTVSDGFLETDVIMTPSAAALPWPAAEPFPPEIDGQPVGPRGHAVYTAWVNACGHPGINLPAAPSAGGLPIGFQLIGDFGADALLLDLAARFEAAHPWAERWPVLSQT